MEDKTYAGYFLRSTGNEKLLQALHKDGLTVKELKILKDKEIKNKRQRKIASEEEENKGEFKFTNDLEEAEIDESDRKAREMDALIEDAISTKKVDADKDNNAKQAFDLRVFTPDSRVVYGVSDPYGQLSYRECFFSQHCTKRSQTPSL